MLTSDKKKLWWNNLTGQFLLHNGRNDDCLIGKNKVAPLRMQIGSPRFMDVQPQRTRAKSLGTSYIETKALWSPKCFDPEMTAPYR